MNMTNMFNGMFGKIAPGMCRMTMNGKIAIKTSNGYKSYNVKTGRLTNQSNFVFDIGEDFFFLIPTSKVEKGDIILVNGTPRCVINIDKTKITVINYEDSTIENVLPERHVFMGSTYFYGKIVSLFGNNFSKKGGVNNIMKYMLMSQMVKGSNASNGMTDSLGWMLPLMMLSGGNVSNIFDGMFNLEDVNFDLGMDETEEDESEDKEME